MTIVVKKLRTVDSGNLKAYADIGLPGGIQIRDLRIVKQPGQKAWVSMPQKEWRNHIGEPCYMPLVTLPRDTMQLVSEAVLLAYYSTVGDAK